MIFFPIARAKWRRFWHHYNHIRLHRDHSHGNVTVTDEVFGGSTIMYGDYTNTVTIKVACTCGEVFYEQSN